MKWIRIAFVLACAALVVASLGFESHEVRPLSQKDRKEGDPSAADAQRVGGLAFTEAAAVESYLRFDGTLYDIYSLTPLASETGLALDVAKKCPT